MSKEKSICLCKILFFCFDYCKISGLLPVAQKSHDPNSYNFVTRGDACQFTVSKFWKFYGFALVAIFCVVLAISIWMYDRSRPVSMNLILFWIYLTYGISMISWSIMNAPIFVNTLNNANEFIRHGLLCNRRKRYLKRKLWLGIIIGNGQFVLQLAASTYLYWRTTGFDQPLLTILRIVFQQIILNNIPFLFTYTFNTVCLVYSILFCCFNTYLEKILLQKPSNQVHQADQLENLTFAEQIDFARRMHEKLRLSLLRFNRSFNPQLFIHVSTELLILVIYLYNVIVYYVVKNNYSDVGKTVNSSNILFLTVHIISLSLLLHRCQLVQRRVRS